MDITGFDLEEVLEKLKTAYTEEDWVLVEDVIDSIWQFVHEQEAFDFAQENGLWSE